MLYNININLNIGKLLFAIVAIYYQLSFMWERISLCYLNYIYDIFSLLIIIQTEWKYRAPLDMPKIIYDKLYLKTNNFIHIKFHWLLSSMLSQRLSLSYKYKHLIYRMIKQFYIKDNRHCMYENCRKKITIVRPYIYCHSCTYVT